jgi:glycerol-3-phosphate dehydrogenase
VKRLAVIGAGSWGTALAIVLAPRFERVRLWVYEAELAERMARARVNDLYLPGFGLPPNVEPVAGLREALEGAEIVLSVVPSDHVRRVYAGCWTGSSPACSSSAPRKGLEQGSLKRMSEVIADVVSRKFPPRIGVLSGPTFAREVARGEPAAVVISSADAALARAIQQAFAGPALRLYTNSDPVGVELGASLKNVIAIAAGVCSGLGLGANTLAALITRGLAEITRLAVAAGGQARTLAGLAGLGDLVLTCHGGLSRNRAVGIELGRGRKLDEILSGMRMVAEGVHTTFAAYELAARLKPARADGEVAQRGIAPLALRKILPLDAGSATMPLMWTYQRIASCLGMLALAAAVVWGQGTTSRVVGVVSDPSGASVPGAVVKLINEGTNATFETKTAENGAYFFEAVPSGSYTVTVEAPGFRRFTSRRNPVTIGQPTTVNVTLEVGAVTEVVEVSGSAEIVQTSTSGNFGNLFTETVIRDLPIVGVRGRNPLDLVTRQPGVVSGANTGGGVHVNGARDRAWNFTIDGIDANETSAGGSNFAPIRMNPDVLSEFRVLTGNATAEYGRNSGGQVAMVTKSGTNEIHGTAWWFYRTPRLSANEWENNINNVGKRQYQQNMPGIGIGGPVIRNKLFYYGNLQILRTRESAVVNSTVYTKEAREGIWRFVKGGRNLPAGVAGAAVDAQGNVLPGVNIGTYNVIAMDPQRLGWDSRTKSIAQAAPLPNNFTLGDGLNTAAYTFTALQLEKQHDVTLRGDYIINSKNTFFARVSFGRQDTNCDRANGGAPVWPGAPCIVNTKRDPKNLAFNWRTMPAPSMTNEFVFGLNQFAFDFNIPTADLTKVDLATPVANPIVYSFGNARKLKTWQFVDNFAWLRGAHNIKFGLNFRLGRHPRPARLHRRLQRHAGGGLLARGEHGERRRFRAAGRHQPAVRPDHARDAHQLHAGPRRQHQPRLPLEQGQLRHRALRFSGEVSTSTTSTSRTPGS